MEVNTPDGSGVDVTINDTIPPVVNIVSPSSNGTYKTSSNTVVISGTASDNISLSKVMWSLDSGESGNAQGTGSWTVSGLPLHAGVNTVTITAYDSSDNATDANLSIELEDISEPAPTDPPDPVEPTDPSNPGNPGEPTDPADTTAPEVTATSPAHNAVSAAQNTSVTANFNEAIDSASLSASVISITGPNGSVAHTKSVQNNKLILAPKSALQAGASYTVSIGAGIKDLAGNAMASDHVWQFTVAQSACTGEYPAGFALVEGMDTTPPGSMSMPAKGVPYTDPAYGTCVVRATDHENEPPSGFARNDYSRRQAFNADGSMMLIYSYNGYWHLYNANDFSYIRQLNMGGSEVEPQWHPTDPNLLYIFPHNGGMTIRKYNVLTDETITVTDFRSVASIAGHPGKTSVQEIWPSAARIWTKSEGSPSMDARYWGLMVETESFGGLGLITYDMQTDTITGVYDYNTDGAGVGRPDHVSMSPTGGYIVSSWYSQACPSGTQLGSLHNPCGLMSYSRDFTSAKGLAKLGEHSDIALDANGNDVIVMSNYVSGYVEMYSLATGATTRLWNMYISGAATALHISGKGYNKPGWVIMSTYATTNPQGATLWYKDKIMAVELKENPRIYNIAHTYNKTDQYFSEPHAVVNRDFTRILFNSNWNTADFQNIDAYMITLPPSVIPAN